MKVKRVKDTESFIVEATKVHGNEYDYSQVEYVASAKKVIITCSKLHTFTQTPNAHLYGDSCKVCSSMARASKILKTTDEFIQDAQKVHLNKYDYSNVVYKGSHTKVEIICP